MNTTSQPNVILPARRTHVTPRLLMADAYTIGSNEFESDEAKDRSIYYVTFRKGLHKVNPAIYAKDDDRLVLVGLQHFLDKLFYVPITHAEIDTTIAFLEFAKITNNGYENYDFPEQIWREVVDKYNGRPPILIEAMPEGSVVYPNEPIIKITSQVKRMGVLAAWFESTILKVWAPSERVTQNEHMLLRIKERIRKVEPDMPEETVHFFATLVITDFGDRAGMTIQETELLGMVHLYTFPGTDSFTGAYQAWENSGRQKGLFSSVNALAHRNVQSYVTEKDCYNALYNTLKPGEIGSYVDDCYDAKNAVNNYLLPLALRSKEEQNNKTVVARPDSSKEGYTTTDQVLEICNLAVKNGLSITKVINNKTINFGTLLKYLDGDGKSFADILDSIDTQIESGFAFYSFGLFGLGGGNRNPLKRDNLSAKYALSAVGDDERPVVKFSETKGKTTLPGNLKILRTPEALANKQTVVFTTEAGENNLIEYFNGLRIQKPYGIGQDDNFVQIKNRIIEQMKTMPLSLVTEKNDNYPASDLVLAKRNELLHQYIPNHK